MFHFEKAITRLPGADFAAGETTQKDVSPDFAKLREQHAAYVGALEKAGLSVQVLPALPGSPDAYFVEDPAVVVPGVAVLTRPGAPSRRAEVAAIQPALAAHRATRTLASPGTLDGGDVLIVDKRVFIGISDRSNEHGARQLADILREYGFDSEFVELAAGLHLKSSVNAIGDNRLLATPEFVGHPAFASFDQFVLPNHEAHGANCLRVNELVLVPANAPETADYLAAQGMEVVSLDVGEVQKMDGGLTCMSLRFS